MRAKYVAQCCFVGSCDDRARLTEPVLLPHGATVADMKREFYRCHAFTTGTEQEWVDALVCKDPGGVILADTNRLPLASATACADFGHHALFFFDIEPDSMKQKHVRQKISKVSSTTIDEFVCTPRKYIGLGNYDGVYPKAFETFREELAERLKADTRVVPPKLSTARLEEVKNKFASLEENDQSSLPLRFR